MLKTESSGERTTLRSASPHRNAYRTEFQALKSTFDKPKSDGEQKTKEGEGSQQSRGRKYGSNVNRIKNLFMQMGMEPSENAAVIAKTRGKGGPSSPQRRMKPKEFLEKTDGSVVKLESSVSERISRFDTMYDGPSYSKFSETRKMFERSVHESGQNNRYSPKKEKAGGSEPQDEWGGSKSNRGSTDSLDSLSSRTEAVSPTVSQLSAVFENTDSPSAIISEKAENSEYSVTGHYPLNLPSVTVTNLDTFGHLKDSNSWSPPSKHSDDAEDAPKSTTSPGLEVASKSTSLASVPSEEAQQSKAAEAPTSSHEAPDRTDRDIPEEAGAESKAVPELEIPSPQNEPSEDAEARLVGGEAAMQQKRELAGGDFAPADVSRFTCEKDVFEEPHHFGSSHVYMHSDYNVYRVRSRYNSDWGETGTEQEEQEDSDENNYCQPDLEYSEIVGLPEEDDIPANRKIKFSSAPIKMCYLHSKDKYDLSGLGYDVLKVFFFDVLKLKSFFFLPLLITISILNDQIERGGKVTSLRSGVKFCPSDMLSDWRKFLTDSEIPFLSFFWKPKFKNVIVAVMNFKEKRLNLRKITFYYVIRPLERRQEAEITYHCHKYLCYYFKGKNLNIFEEQSLVACLIYSRRIRKSTVELKLEVHPSLSSTSDLFSKYSGPEMKIDDIVGEEECDVYKTFNFSRFTKFFTMIIYYSNYIEKGGHIWNDQQKRQPTPGLLPGKFPRTEEPGRLQTMRVAQSQARLSNFTLKKA
ncbi:hypothetical protein FD754_022391 [Muntiacus muntjak]|uniref:Neurabin-1/2 PDZ domain-containing protein n=1 Tax=Muntiacus muntjak TaxID=9888 RepID=A0A5N3V8N2_MUNMU|nr:hypothetical protein FD754_022391 [Muntiacus muntjak]